VGSDGPKELCVRSPSKAEPWQPLFGSWWAIILAVWLLATHCLILGVGLPGQAIRWRHSWEYIECLRDVATATNFGTKIKLATNGRCHGNHFHLSIYGVYTGATWQIWLNRPWATAMRPYVKLLWPLVEYYTCWWAAICIIFSSNDFTAHTYQTIQSLPVYEVYNIQVFAFKIVHDDECPLYIMSEKRVPLLFSSLTLRIVNCRPIFKILSPTDSAVNFWKSNS